MPVSLPVTPVFPAPVSPGLIISSSDYGNVVRQSLLDLWTDMQAVAGAVAPQTPWTSSIDAAEHDLNNLGIVRFADTQGSGPNAAMANESGTLHLLTDNGGSLNFESIGTGRVLISTDGTRRIVVHQNGNVGVGPSMNPSYKLDVAGDLNITGIYRVNGVPIATSGGGQTPWTQDIDAAGFRLLSAGNVGLRTATVPAGHTMAGRTYLTIRGQTEAGVLELAHGAADADLAQAGHIAFTDPNNVSATDKRVATIAAHVSGTTAGNRGGYLVLNTRVDAGTQIQERARITNTGAVGIGTQQPLTRLHVASDTGPQLAVSTTSNTAKRLLCDVSDGLSMATIFFTQAGVGNLPLHLNLDGQVGVGYPGTFNASAQQARSVSFDVNEGTNQLIVRVKYGGGTTKSVTLSLV